MWVFWYHQNQQGFNKVSQVQLCLWWRACKCVRYGWYLLRLWGQLQPFYWRNCNDNPKVLFCLRYKGNVLAFLLPISIYEFQMFPLLLANCYGKWLSIWVRWIKGSLNKQFLWSRRWNVPHWLRILSFSHLLDLAPPFGTQHTLI